MNTFKPNPKHARLTIALLGLAIAAACMCGGWYLWPEPLGVATLGEVPVRWIAKTVLSLWLWLVGLRVAVSALTD